MVKMTCLPGCKKKRLIIAFLTSKNLEVLNSKVAIPFIIGNMGKEMLNVQMMYFKVKIFQYWIMSNVL